MTVVPEAERKGSAGKNPWGNKLQQITRESEPSHTVWRMRRGWKLVSAGEGVRRMKWSLLPVAELEQREWEGLCQSVLEKGPRQLKEEEKGRSKK